MVQYEEMLRAENERFRARVAELEAEAARKDERIANDESLLKDFVEGFDALVESLDIEIEGPDFRRVYRVRTKALKRLRIEATGEGVGL